MPDYSKLITEARLRDSESGTELPLSIAYESNKSRILFSAPFRRLQQKAQVFSLEPNAAVRSRLTHSLEAAYIGRFISRNIIQAFRDKNDPLTDELASAFITAVDSACLMHDIGNPPFGHSGEEAIQLWFKEHQPEFSSLDEDYYKDFLHFDGNPQGFRIATKLQGKPGTGGFNLTCTQLAAYLKYAHSPKDFESKEGKKPGYFLTEQGKIDIIFGKLGLEQGTRFPLAYLMEASDDIAYALSDLEDALEKGIITKTNLKARLLEEWKNTPSKKDDFFPIHLKRLDDDDTHYWDWTIFRAYLVADLVKFAANKYVEQHEQFLDGSAIGIFKNASPEKDALKAISKVAVKHVYQSREAEDLELAGRKIISGLLDHFHELMICDEAEFTQILEGKNNSKLAQKLARKLPQTHLLNYKKEREMDPTTPELAHRLHMIVDFISGMTDDYALETHQLLSGIRVR